MTEEASHIISAQLVLDEFGNAIPGAYVPSENFKDAAQDALIRNFYFDATITRNFFDRASDIVDGVKPGGMFAQLGNPTMMDVGWGTGERSIDEMNCSGPWISHVTWISHVR